MPPVYSLAKNRSIGARAAGRWARALKSSNSNNPASKRNFVVCSLLFKVRSLPRLYTTESSLNLDHDGGITSIELAVPRHVAEPLAWQRLN